MYCIYICIIKQQQNIMTNPTTQLATPRTTVYEQWGNNVVVSQVNNKTTIYLEDANNVYNDSYFTPHTSVRMFFNSVLCEVTIAESSKYFGSEYNYQIWDTHAVISSDGNGMKECPRINASEAVILTSFGMFRLRSITDNDKKIYGVNNFKGLYLEPIK